MGILDLRLKKNRFYLVKTRKRFSVGILEAITLSLKELIQFLQKKRQMNSKISISQDLKKLRLPFFKLYGKEKEDMMWMDKRARYHICKITSKYCQKFDLLCML